MAELKTYFDGLAAFSRELAGAKFSDEDALWDLAIRKTAPYLNCMVATFFEADDNRRTLTFRKSIGPVAADVTGISFPYKGIAGWCAEKREALLVNDAEADERFTKNVDRGTGFKTRSVIAVPVLFKGSLVGVLEYINSMAGGFTPEELSFARMVAELFARELFILRLENTVKQLNMRGESTINNLSGGFIGVDLDGKVMFFNPKAKEIFGVGDEYAGQPILSFSQVAPELVNAIANVLKQGATVRRQEFSCPLAGRVKRIGYSTINIKGVDGKVIGAGAIFQDITDL